jgi:hypothetical protein
MSARDRTSSIGSVQLVQRYIQQPVACLASSVECESAFSWKRLARPGLAFVLLSANARGSISPLMPHNAMGKGDDTQCDERDRPSFLLRRTIP